MSAVRPVFATVPGQEAAVHLLSASVTAPLHAYLFVGPPGTGKRQAAKAFAAALFCEKGGCGSCTSCKETLAGRHPDLVVAEREGAVLSVAQASEIVRLAARSPRAAPYLVLVLCDLHLVGPAAPRLLKTIEEPPTSTVMVLTAESVPPELVTIASRCSQVDFRPLAEEAITAVLVGSGTDPTVAGAVAAAAEGRLDRARLLAGDAGLSERIARWRSVPESLDGTGATASRLASELLEAAGEPVALVASRQQEELAALFEEATSAGERGISGRAEIEARHRREQRRTRTDELRAGLATLSSVYRSRLTGSATAARGAIAAIAAIDEAAERLALNVDETLLLQWLFIELDRPG